LPSGIAEEVLEIAQNATVARQITFASKRKGISCAKQEHTYLIMFSAREILPPALPIYAVRTTTRVVMTVLLLLALLSNTKFLRMSVLEMPARALQKYAARQIHTAVDPAVVSRMSVTEELTRRHS
jgi:hypothetical protein